MVETRTYEQGEFQFEFTPGEEGSFAGLLLTRMADQEPYAADVNLSKPRSRNEYVKEAAEFCGVDAQELKNALISLCARRREEVNAESSEQAADETAAEPEVAQEVIDELVGRPDVLDRIVEAIATFSGVVGERPMLKLISLAALSAQLELMPNGKPLAANLMLTAAAGRGKNYLFDAVAWVLPPEFYYAFESSSAKALYYAAENNPAVLKHRWGYPNEAEATDQIIETLRPLLSGGKARHTTVNKDSNGANVWREYELEGPVVLTIATVRNKLDGQLQSRMLVAGLEDYEGRVAAHSGAVSAQLDLDYSGTDYGQEIAAWQAALRSLTGIRRVVVPVSYEGFRFDRDDVSHGARLWTNFLGLMCAHVWLEQRNRQIVDLPNGEKAIVATPEDYETAYRIFEATCERSVVNLSEAHRKILDALYEMYQEDKNLDWPFAPDGYTQRQIAEKSGVPQSTISDNKTYLVKSLKLLRETSNGLALIKDASPSWWRKDDVLAGFPRPEQVRAWWSGEDEPPDPDTPGHADQPNEIAQKNDENGEHSDRDIPGRHPQAAGRLPHEVGEDQHDRLDEPTDRSGGGHEKGAETPNPGSEGDLTGVTGGSGTYAVDRDKSRGASGGNGDEEYHAELERRLGPGWATRPKSALLDELGWSKITQVPAAVPSNSREPLQLESDPVAEEILQWTLTSYKGTFSSYAVSARKFAKEPELWRERGYPAPSWWPSTEQEMQEHLQKLAPVLREKGMLVEYWEKNEAEPQTVAVKNFWLFVPSGTERPTPEDLAECAWVRVAYLEGIGDDDPFDVLR